jgi:hypothetical protein
MTEEEYKKFNHQCIHELQDHQAKLWAEHDLDAYPRWDYDQHTALLTFSDNDEEINFRFVEVGSFSEKSNTWKWAWDNAYVLEKVKKETFAVKEFGEKNDIKELSEGYFEANEADGWAITAVTCKLLGGIGAYRPVSDHLLVFMVLMEVVDNKEAQKIKNKVAEEMISCDCHGKGRASFVCQHLIGKGTAAGFHEAFETEQGMDLQEDDSFQAWCNECETERLKQGEWNDENIAFANIKVVCESCYFEMKERNSEQ